MNICQKNGNFLGQKWVSLALFSILSAQTIIIVHPSLGFIHLQEEKITVHNHNILVKKGGFLYYLMWLKRIEAGICGNRCAWAIKGTWPSLVTTPPPLQE